MVARPRMEDDGARGTFEQGRPARCARYAGIPRGRAGGPRRHDSDRRSSPTQRSNSDVWFARRQNEMARVLRAQGRPESSRRRTVCGSTRSGSFDCARRPRSRCVKGDDTVDIVALRSRAHEASIKGTGWTSRPTCATISGVKDRLGRETGRSGDPRRATPRNE